MLEKLMLTNFQSHESTEITFGDRVTVIHGPTNNGKSSVLRALDWVCNNGLDGDYFLSNWLKRGGRCAVSLTVDGHTITRERSKSDNVYALDGVEYKAFSRGVPSPILNLLNLSPHTFQRQGDQPFLIGGTGSAAVEVFNTAAGLSDIDAVESEIRTRKSANDACIRSADEQIEECGKKLRETEPWVALHALLQDADSRSTVKEMAEDSYNEIVASLGRLDNLLPTVTFDSALLDTAQEAKSAIDEPTDAHKRAQDALQSLDKLKPCVDLSDDLLTQAGWLGVRVNKTISDHANTTLAIRTFDALRPPISLTEPQWPVLDPHLRFEQCCVGGALQSLDNLKPPLALDTPHWPERPTSVDHKDITMAIAQLDSLKEPDIERAESLDYELATFSFCPLCGAHRPYWDLKRSVE